jgi:hypothetical protein
MDTFEFDDEEILKLTKIQVKNNDFFSLNKYKS